MASRILGHPTVSRRAAALLLLGTAPSWAQGAAASSRVAPSVARPSTAPEETLAPPKDAGVASAQSATVPVPGYGDRATWDAGYAQARALFERGEFAQASAEFLALAQRAPTQFDSARAQELGQLAFNWHQRGLALVDRKSLVGSDLEARSSDRRTADEIGVLYTTSVVYGVATGLWFDVQSEPSGVSTAVLPPLLLAGAAVGGVALLDSGRGLRYGVAQSMASGMYIGLWQGISWTTYLQASTTHQNQLSAKQYATALWSAATLGAVVGGVVGTASSTTPGRASFVSSTSLWPAFVLGMGVAGLSTDNQYRDDHAFLAASLGASGGVVAGILTAGTISPTTARVRFLDLGGLGGTLVGGGLYLAAAGNHAKFEPAATISALGAAAGLSVAWFATANMPRDEGAVQRTASLDVHPQISPQRGGATLGLSGTF